MRLPRLPAIPWSPVKILYRLAEFLNSHLHLGFVSLSPQYQGNRELPNPKVSGNGLLRIPRVPHACDFIDLLRGQLRITMGTARGIIIPAFRYAVCCIVLVSSLKQMLTLATWRIIAVVADQQGIWIFFVMEKISHSVDRKLPPPNPHRAMYSNIRDKWPAVSMRAMASGFIDVGVELGDVFLAERRKWSTLVSRHLISSVDRLLRAASGDNHPWPNLHYSTEVC